MDGDARRMGSVATCIASRIALQGVATCIASWIVLQDEQRYCKADGQ